MLETFTIFCVLAIYNFEVSSFSSYNKLWSILIIKFITIAIITEEVNLTGLYLYILPNFQHFFR